MMTRLPSLVTALVAAAHVARVTAQLPRDQLQLPHVAHVDTDAQLRSREPFVLRSGELYRDLLTIRTSQLAAVFARQFEAAMGPRLRRLRARTSSRLARPPPPPTFASAARGAAARRGRVMPDEEIFDFTDSRFLRPPTDNQRNHPGVAVVRLQGRTFVTPAPSPAPVIPSAPAVPVPSIPALPILTRLRCNCIPAADVHTGGLTLVSHPDSQHRAWGHLEEQILVVAGPSACTAPSAGTSAAHYKDLQVTRYSGGSVDCYVTGLVDTC